MDFLTTSREYINPEEGQLEIVERKGLGHPDTLADGLAEAISIAYSRYCLDQFGVVLHHNIDKLYIGSGLFISDFGGYVFKKPIKVVVNGRVSNSFGGQTIDLDGLFDKTAREFLKCRLPNLQTGQLEVINNSTQHTTRPYWFSPRNLGDLPENQKLVAGDTSVCVAHWARTTCEMLAYELEQYFRKLPAGSSMLGKIGQDIKVMVVRDIQDIDITICLPVLAGSVRNKSEYDEVLNYFEKRLNNWANILLDDWRSPCFHNDYKINLKINPNGEGGYRHYLLGIGSCVECGEEGLVGRGNSSLGVISTFRPHSMEAPAGKNPVYHTGRVMGYLTQRLAKAIHHHFDANCSVISLAKNNQALIPPEKLVVYTDRNIPRDELEKLVGKKFIRINYLEEILENRMII